MQKTILLMGSEEDPHIQALQSCLRKSFNVAGCVFNPGRDLAQPGLTWGDFEVSLFAPFAEPIHFEEISAGFWRSITALPECGPNSQQSQLRSSDCSSFLRVLVKESTFPWINGWEAFDLHFEKPRQLRAASRAGVLTPRTLVTNDPMKAHAFCQAEEAVIIKPVSSGDYARCVSRKEATLQRLTELMEGGPKTIQQYIPGQDIRTYVIGDEIFSVAIESSMVDFRLDPAHKLRRYCLPKSQEKILPRLMADMRLDWTAIDWRRAEDGTFYYLEANFSPFFLRVEQETGHPITRSLCDLLTAQN